MTKHTRKKNYRYNRSKNTKRIFPNSYGRYDLIKGRKRSGYADFKLKIFKIKKLREKTK